MSKKLRIEDLVTADELHAESMQDPEYAAEYERTRFANAVAIAVLKYRAEHQLSQAGLGELLGLDEADVFRLESGDEPTVRVHQEDGRTLWAEVDGLPGCFAAGDTKDELQADLAAEVSLYLDCNGDEDD